MSNDNAASGAIVPAQQPAKALVSIGHRGLQPSDMDGLWRAAQAVAKSGLAPKGIDTPEAVFVAMEMGLELGLPLMASLQNIAVVNGRPTLWGDSQLAVVRATGELEEFSEWYEQDGKRLARNPSTFDDATAAVCRVKRRGMEASETAFTVGDAKRANLWGKQGPWSQYPARMLRFRARSFALRDQFGDALRGLLSTEEAGDVVEVTPTAAAVTVAKPVFRAPPAIAENTATPVPTFATDDGDLAPAQPKAQPAPAPVAEAAPTEPTEPPQQRLAALVTGAGVTWDQFAPFLEHHKYATGDGTGFDGLPTAIASRLLRSPDKLIDAVRAFLQPA